MILLLLYLSLAWWMVVFNLRPIQSLDCWWHLASGRYMVESWTLPFIDPFSLLCRGSPWVDSYWLFEIILFTLYRWVGLSGLLLAKGMLIVAALLFQDQRLRENRVQWLWRVLALVGIFLSGHPRGYGWSEQASLVTFFFFSLVLWQLEHFRQRGWSRLFWAGPILFMLWANMHRGFILGGVVATCYLLVETTNSTRETRKRLIWLALCGLATLATPYGFRLFRMIFDDLTLSSVNVAGWLRPPWGHLEFFWISLVLFWVALGIQSFKYRKPPPRGPLIAAIFLTWTGTRYVANIPYFMLFTWPWMVEILAGSTWAQSVSRFSERHAKVLQPSFLMIMMGALLMTPVRGGVNTRIFPVDACDFVEREKIVGPFYHDYAFGGYWMWRFAGERPVFIDGRYPAVRGYQPLQAQINAAKIGPPEGWGEFLNRSGVQAVLIGYPRSQTFPSVSEAYFPKEQWALVYWDDVAQVFVRRIPAHSGLVARQEFKYVRPDAQEMYFLERMRKAGPTQRRGFIQDLSHNLQMHPSSTRARRMLQLAEAAAQP